jgi:hypothetical protein
MGVFGKPKQYFLTPEIAKRVREGYKKIPTQAIAVSLGLPIWMIGRFASELGLSRIKEPRWSEKELAFLAAVRPLTTVPIVASVLKRTVEAVKIVTVRRKIKRPRITRGQEFGFQGVLSEDQVLKMWERFGEGALVVPLPERPVRIDPRRRIWTTAEIEYLKEFAGHKPTSLLARYLHRSLRAVQHRLHYLGIRTLDNQGYLATALVQSALGVSSKTPIYLAIKKGFLKPKRPGMRYFAFPPEQVDRLKARRAERRAARPHRPGC